MAGQPKKRALIMELERRKCAEFEDEEMSNLEYVARLIEGGANLRGITRSITEACKLDLGDAALTNYLYRTWPDEASVRLQRARQIGSHALVDEATEIVDEASTADREHLKKAELRANDRRWRAERYNKAELAGVNSPVIQVNLNTLHLDALRKFNREPAVTARIASSSVGAVEVEQVNQ